MTVCHQGTDLLLYPQRKSSWYPLGRRLGGPQSLSGSGGVEKNSHPLPRLEPPIIQPGVLRCTAELSRLICVLFYRTKTSLFLSAAFSFTVGSLSVSRRSSVNIVTRLRTGIPGFDSRYGEGRDFFLFFTASRPVLGPTQPHIQWVPGSHSPEVKRLVSKADHSFPSSVEVKKALSCTSTPPIRPHSMVRS
jgi:hypothetical protein